MLQQKGERQAVLAAAQREAQGSLREVECSSRSAAVALVGERLEQAEALGCSWFVEEQASRLDLRGTIQQQWPALVTVAAEQSTAGAVPEREERAAQAQVGTQPRPRRRRRPLRPRWQQWRSRNWRSIQRLHSGWNGCGLCPAPAEQAAATVGLG